MDYVELVIKQLDLKELEEDYVSKGISIEKLAKKYKVGRATMSKVIKKLKLSRDTNKIRNDKISKTKSVRFNDIVSNINREELYQKYIVEDKSYEEMTQELNVTEYTFDRILNHFNIHKDKKQSYLKGLQTKARQYGSVEKYHKQANKVRQQTIIEKYGSVENYKQHLREKNIRVWRQLKTKQDFEERNIKTIKTCRKKYGVDFPCQRIEARNAGSNDSQPNLTFASKLTEAGVEFEREFAIGRSSFDFKVGNTLIEINPTVTHNVVWHPFGSDHTPKQDKFYHRDKTVLAREHGFNCIHVFDWDDVDKVVKIFTEKERVFARKCKIKELSKEESRTFLNSYHLQGDANDSIRIGLLFDDEIISIMTFDVPRYNKNFDYELIRYATSKNVVGGAEKLFKYFLNLRQPQSVISYNDTSKFSGRVYNRLGFVKHSKTLRPSKHWYNIKTNKHITDNLLRQRGADQLLGTEFGVGTDNEEIMLKNGFLPVYDSGQETLVWKNTK